MSGADGEEQAKFFLAVTTGQNVSNLPPILECATPGRDAVLWLESDFAHKQRWSKGAIEVLQSRGFDNVETELLPEEPGEIWTALSKIYKRCEDGGYAPLWVANGGSKPTSLAIQASQLARSTALPILYSEPQPAEYWLMPDGITGPRHKRRYEKSALTLEEVLVARGHFIKNPKTAEKIWSAQEGAPRFPGALRFADDSYGEDGEQTCKAHEDAARREDLLERAKAARTDRPVSLDDALDEFPEHLTGWLEGVWNTARTIAVSDGNKPRNWLQFGKDCSEQLSGLFASTQNTAGKIRYELFKRHDEDGAAFEQDQEKFAARFERAVARRTCRWLETHKKALPVNEAWLNVKIAAQRDRSRIVQELDIVLVLANAVLISLECKTFQADRKDLDARLLNIRRSGSQLARLVVCAPLFTTFSDASWFKQQHGLSQTLKAFGFQYIPFTLPGQPKSYPIAASDGAADATEEFDCLPFEDHLHKLLKPYVPQWRETGGQRAGNVT